jgi:hypothetical protein
VPNTSGPDLSLFLDIVHKLEALGIPYVIIGDFAATIYGITRATYDIDIIVDLTDEHIQALSAAYPLPRFYADPHQMRRAMQNGKMARVARCLTLCIRRKTLPSSFRLFSCLNSYP